MKQLVKTVKFLHEAGICHAGERCCSSFQKPCHFLYQLHSKVHNAKQTDIFLGIHLTSVAVLPPDIWNHDRETIERWIGKPEGKPVIRAGGKPLEKGIPVTLYRNAEWMNYLQSMIDCKVAGWLPLMDVCLLDFGGSFFEDKKPETLDQSVLTQAPETLLMGAFDYKVDTWALGDLMYFLLTERDRVDPDSVCGREYEALREASWFVEDIPEEWMSEYLKMRQEEELAEWNPIHKPTWLEHMWLLDWHLAFKSQSHKRAISTIRGMMRLLPTKRFTLKEVEDELDELVLFVKALTHESHEEYHKQMDVEFLARVEATFKRRRTTECAPSDEDESDEDESDEDEVDCEKEETVTSAKTDIMPKEEDEGLIEAALQQATDEKCEQSSSPTVSKSSLTDDHGSQSQTSPWASQSPGLETSDQDPMNMIVHESQQSEPLDLTCTTEPLHDHAVQASQESHQEQAPQQNTPSVCDKDGNLSDVKSPGPKSTPSQSHDSVEQEGLQVAEVGQGSATDLERIPQTPPESRDSPASSQQGPEKASCVDETVQRSEISDLPCLNDTPGLSATEDALEVAEMDKNTFQTGNIADETEQRLDIIAELPSGPHETPQEQQAELIQHRSEESRFSMILNHLWRPWKRLRRF
ncbi:unnamed protein product [Penicillium olsonii]|nr:unnamed protein product [Penicillium olsonii]